MWWHTLVVQVICTLFTQGVMSEFELSHGWFFFGSSLWFCRWRFCRLRQLLDSLHPSLLLMQTRQEGYAADEFFFSLSFFFVIKANIEHQLKLPLGQKTWICWSSNLWPLSDFKSFSHYLNLKPQTSLLFLHQLSI